ncbi:hypothetical protein BpHYR1_007171 [Brachionus plicatilis]|uniref:Uncharacterized protein n=1 Tax=Brachionus plicatilis TaxID=10195 RepID=A0A3M7S6Z5_BRAPC|nr:hypothetical protein BpHYR1_007171 [Brachionus plicatilis]
MINKWSSVGINSFLENLIKQMSIVHFLITQLNKMTKLTVFFLFEYDLMLYHQVTSSQYDF